MNVPSPEPIVQRQMFVDMPKIDLHRHLEGSVRLTTLMDIARQYKIELPVRDMESLRAYVQITPDSPMNSAHFLSKFNLLRRFYYSQEVIERVAREAVEDAAADNVKYMELRFTPKALSKLMNFAFNDVVRWVCNAVTQAQADGKIKVRLIVSMNRHESAKEGERTLEAALAYKDRGVVGIDLAGQESDFDFEPFHALFEQGRKAGFGITIHAGEWAGPHNVRDAIVSMGADRIGHGVRVVEDNRISRLALEKGIAFEVCPTSNVQSGAVPNLEQHPLRDMTQLGLKTTINTDDPSISNITLSDELILARYRLGMTLDEIKRTVISSANCAFLPAAEKSQLIEDFTKTMMGVKES